MSWSRLLGFCLYDAVASRSTDAVEEDGSSGVTAVATARAWTREAEMRLATATIAGRALRIMSAEWEKEDVKTDQLAVWWQSAELAAA